MMFNALLCSIRSLQTNFSSSLRSWKNLTEDCGNLSFLWAARRGARLAPKLKIRMNGRRDSPAGEKGRRQYKDNGGGATPRAVPTLAWSVRKHYVSHYRPGRRKQHLYQYYQLELNCRPCFKSLHPSIHQSTHLLFHKSLLFLKMSWKAGLSRNLTVLRFFGCPKSPSSNGVM